MSYKVSACICTRNRPDELKSALESLERSTYPIFEVIVSDDSTNSDTQVLIHSRYPNVKYLPGPRQGLGANRNNALKAATGSHVFFIDDDVILGKDFLEKAFAYLETYLHREGGDREKIIVSGAENKRGELVFPQEQSFLGFQVIKYGKKEELKTAVINSTIFPRKLFEKVAFDEKLVYGCDEVDLTTRSERAGFKIIFCPAAINFHFPSDINRDFYRPYHEASRLYVTFKRYFSTEKNTLKALAYLAIASAHTLAHSIKVEGLPGIFKALGTFQTVFSYLVREYFLERKSETGLNLK